MAAPSLPILLRLAASGAAGLLFGAVCAGAALAAAPGNLVGDAARDLHLLVPHLGSAISRIVGGWWGWGAAPTLAALVMARRIGRQSTWPPQSPWLRATAAAWLFLVCAVVVYYLADPLAHVTLDVVSLGLWLAGSFIVAPVMGLIGQVGASGGHWGTLVRVLIPLSGIVDVLVNPPSSVATRATAWSELIGCLVLIGLAALWAILAFARSSHELVQARSASVATWESQRPAPWAGSGRFSTSGAGRSAPSTASRRPSASGRSAAA